MAQPILKIFTLDEARALLPRVRELLDAAMQARASIAGLAPELLPALERAAGNGHHPAAGRVAAELEELRDAVSEILDLGVLVKDLERGLVDFLSIRDGREVCLCWEFGESDIAWWHDLESGYAGRRPL